MWALREPREFAIRVDRLRENDFVVAVGQTSVDFGDGCER